ncbi:hypothetical protein ACQ5T2_17750, partial [Vibrio cholerae]|uniref:hypothetical protein n=1 Tax=Vibrio cholerae TaxID=666 RepID=UPI003D3440C1
TKGKKAQGKNEAKTTIFHAPFAFGLAYSTAWGKPPKQTIHWGEFKLRWGGLSVSAPPFLAFFVGKKPPANVTLSPLTFGDRYVF